MKSHSSPEPLQSSSQQCPSHYNFQKLDQEWQEAWEVAQVYTYDDNAAAEQGFIIDTPPPYASGDIHMGHVFGLVQADCIARYKRLKGFNVRFPMGFDDNGLPTERMVEKKTNIKSADVSRQEFRNLCMEHLKSTEASFICSIKRLGLSLDWSISYQTIDDRCARIAQSSFIDLFNKKQLRRTMQPALWDTIDQTALAQAELVEAQEQTHMHHITFWIKEQAPSQASKSSADTQSNPETTTTNKAQKIVIATTRPELIPACVAIFYNPCDPRYVHLEGKQAIVPLTGFVVPILKDEKVDIEKGSGIVMCCTFGDVTDIYWWRTHRLPLRTIINRSGFLHFTHEDWYKKEAALSLGLTNKREDQPHITQLEGLGVEQARASIVQMLTQSAHLINSEPCVHQVKCAERSGAKVEFLVSPQWMINLCDHKAELLKATELIQWHPAHMQNKAVDWIKNLSWDWCISRQRSFGIAFPVWFSKRLHEEGKVILPELNELPVDPTQNLPKGYEAWEVQPDTDVMDTWATSSLTPQINAGSLNCKHAQNSASKSYDTYKKTFPATLRFQGHEIIRTWAFYSIAKAWLHDQSIPFEHIMINGWVLAEKGAKMSKSKGNIVRPLEIIQDKGVDVLRYWASSFAPGIDVILSQDAFSQGERLTKKLWNAARFINNFVSTDVLASSNLFLSKAYSDESFHLLDRWIAFKTALLQVSFDKHMQKFDYANARRELEDFFWKVFCDFYLEAVKHRSYQGQDQERNQAITTTKSVYICLLKMWCIFVPHISEEIFRTILGSRESIHLKGSWPEICADLESQDMKALLELGEVIRDATFEIRKIKTQNKLSLKANLANVDISLSSAVLQVATKMNRHLTWHDFEKANSIANLRPASSPLIDLETEAVSDRNFFLKVQIYD